MRRNVPPQLYFIVSAVFHYLGPALAVLLFTRIEPLGVAWLRIASAGLIFAAWRRPWRAWRILDTRTRRLAVGWGAVLALILAVAGVYLLTDIRLSHDWIGLLCTALNALLFAAYVVLGHRVSRAAGLRRIDGLALAMGTATVLALPVGAWAAVPAFRDLGLLAAAVGVGVCSSVIPYVADQLAMARLKRSTFALMLALLPATATVIGAVVLRQIPQVAELVAVA
ncbi:MAG TPA: hypothetical protein VFH76_33455, partial [Kribbella sp.]|nr:hypothetical protein [Kribbella sp.]